MQNTDANNPMWFSGLALAWLHKAISTLFVSALQMFNKCLCLDIATPLIVSLFLEKCHTFKLIHKEDKNWYENSKWSAILHQIQIQTKETYVISCIPQNEINKTIPLAESVTSPK